MFLVDAPPTRADIVFGLAAVAQLARLCCHAEDQELEFFSRLEAEPRSGGVFLCSKLAAPSAGSVPALPVGATTHQMWPLLRPAS